MASPISPILFESITDDVILLDIPASISSPPSLLLRSTPPPSSPYTLPEPAATTADPSPELLTTHARLAPLLDYALSTITAHGPSTACHPRSTSPPPPGEPQLHHEILSLLAPSTLPPISLTSPTTTVVDISDIHDRHITNPSPTAWKTLTLTYPAPSATFHIPPASSFRLAPVTPTRALPPATYDCIVLDPPWPNRSVDRRAARGYATTDRREIVPMLKSLALGDAAADGALVGVWVTNRPALQRALKEEILLAWGCDVVAEWVWVKVTQSGTPVFSIDSRMRKPYEILVLARRRRRGAAVTDFVDIVPPKVIMAVPDVHSRKPCVKDLLEQYLPTPYKGAEVFGRNLTEGWFTWGDEAIKYNWDGHWVQRKPPEQEKEKGTQVRLMFS